MADAPSPAESIFQRRLVLVTGKGGVGKTTIAAGLAKAFAARGKRVLLAEVAPDLAAPSALSEALGSGPIGEEPLRVAPNLDAVLLTPAMGHRRFLQDALPLRLLADAAMRSSAVRKFLSAAPGFNDMGVMYRMLDLIRRRRPDGTFEYEACVVDSPATGHALALAQIPELLVRVVPAGPIARAAKEGLALLTDPGWSGAVVVTQPETLPVTEALELCAGLQRHRVPVTAIVLNQVPKDPFTPEERAAVDRLLEEQPPLLGTRELSRIDRAAAAARALGDRPPAPVLSVHDLPDRDGALTDRIAATLAPRTTPE